MRAVILIMFLFSLCTVIIAVPAHAQTADAGAADHEKRIQELEQNIEEMRSELEALRAGEPAQESELAETSPAEPSGSAMLIPDISIVVDGVGRTSTNKQEEGRNQFQLREVELAVQGYLYPQIRGDVFVAFEEEELQGRIEEAYVSILQIGDTSLTANAGKKYLDFGKNNPVHREKWPFTTQPFVVRNFLNPEEGLTGQGGQLNYLLPTKGRLFGQLSLGIWKPSAHAHEEEEEGPELGLGAVDRVYTGRLWLSKAMGDSAEVELGLNGAGGPNEEELGGGKVRLYGIDFTYRAWPGTFRRMLIQGEAMRHRRNDVSRDGYYLLGFYRWDKYNDAGLRYDWSEIPGTESGHDSGLSPFYTRWLTETSYVRLQVTRGSSADTGKTASVFLQFVWGLGPHAHQLQ